MNKQHRRGRRAGEYGVTSARPIGRARHVVTAGVAAALLCGASVQGVHAAPADELPAIVAPPSNEHHPGKVIFAELVTPDLAAAKTFYAAMFGWTFKDVALGAAPYAEAFSDGRPVAGLVQRPLPASAHRQSVWLTFIAVPDVDAARAAAVQQGAKVLFEPHTFPGRGREAVLADPQGAVFAVLDSSSGDPPDMLAEAGEWIWSSLITRDPDADAAFYQRVFGYDVYDLPSSAEAQHFILASDNVARASANPMPADRPNAHPAWLDFVRVHDADKAAIQATALGGHVLVAAYQDRHGGRAAIVADPFGAPLGLMEWSDDAPAGAAK